MNSSLRTKLSFLCVCVCVCVYICMCVCVCVCVCVWLTECKTPHRCFDIVTLGKVFFGNSEPVFFSTGLWVVESCHPNLKTKKEEKEKKEDEGNTFLFALL